MFSDIDQILYGDLGRYRDWIEQDLKECGFFEEALRISHLPLLKWSDFPWSLLNGCNDHIRVLKAITYELHFKNPHKASDLTRKRISKPIFRKKVDVYLKKLIEARIKLQEGKKDMLYRDLKETEEYDIYKEVLSGSDLFEDILLKSNLMEEGYEFSQISTPRRFTRNDFLIAVTMCLCYWQFIYNRKNLYPDRQNLKGFIAEELDCHVRVIGELRNDLIQSDTEDCRFHWDIFLWWKQRLEKFLLNEGFMKELRELTLEPVQSKPIMYAQQAEMINDYLSQIELLIYKFQKGTIESSEIIGDRRAKIISLKLKKLFIVHGHDEDNLNKLRDLLKNKHKLECIIMKFQPGKGRTLIEKFEQEAGDAGFAFILMTPDDLVEIPGKKEQYAQARPNVIFELGWFHGKLGRNRVCILFKKGTQIHSDLAGVSRIEFNDSVEEKVLEIERELRAAGLIE